VWKCFSTPCSPISKTALFCLKLPRLCPKMKSSMERSRNIDRRKRKYWKKTLFQYHFFHHKYHKTNSDLNYTQTFSSYLMENLVGIHYKGRSVKAVRGINLYLLLGSYKTYRCTVWKKSLAFTNHNCDLSITNAPYHSGPKFFQKSRSHLQILGTTMMTWSKFRTDSPQFWSDLWTIMLSGPFCLVHVNWYTFLYMKKNAVNTMLKMLGATAQNLVNQVPKIFPPCLNVQIHYLAWDFISVCISL
jgi:hypothetical protein